ncbi:MAG TPA: DsbE family thiol:disulfide interchange protein [Sphingomicrobium sp.]|nr:DsbE family thiol:disulfide interchange protein [Sphingomicrobium sp.]
MGRWLRFLPVLLLALVVGAMVWRLANPPDTTIESKLIGQPAPQFAGEPALAGKPVLSSADLADGRPKLVNFFASWCVPCMAEAPVLMELKRRGVPIVGIAVRDRPADVAEFLASNGEPFERIAADPESELQLAFGSAGVPETFLVDGRGVVRMEHVGPIEPGDIREIVEAVESAR